MSVIIVSILIIILGLGCPLIHAFVRLSRVKVKDVNGWCGDIQRCGKLLHREQERCWRPLSIFLMSKTNFSVTQWCSTHAPLHRIDRNLQDRRTTGWSWGDKSSIHLQRSEMRIYLKMKTVQEIENYFLIKAVIDS